MTTTPQSNRIHIAFYGTTNSGKSSLINAITNQDISLVSDIAGTTTDPVVKSMEISTIGACVLVDTAGFDDDSALGEKRIERTKKTLDKANIAVLVIDATKSVDSIINENSEWINTFAKRQTPVLIVLNKADLVTENELDIKKKSVTNNLSCETIACSSKTKDGILQMVDALREIAKDIEEPSITGDLCKAGDTVVLVMPQDAQAPKGRLILPQVQTTRELLEKNCTIISCTTEGFVPSLNALKNPPDLIITDSQAFKEVYKHTPKESKLTSFSILFAALKGDIKEFAKGASAIEKLTENSKVLIAEACTHAPLEEDIGRVKIPNLLRKKIGQKLTIDVVAGADFKKDLSQYDLIIHCGSCMFTQKHLMSRIEQAKEHKVPITNYGIAIAHLNGILDKVVLPK